MGSARLQQLMEQRNKYKSFQAFSDKRKLFPSGSLGSAAASLARKSAETELNVKTQKYNDGLIGNDEMLTFLKSFSQNPQLSQSERADVEGQVRDFTDRIRVEALTANYNKAQKGTIDKIQAAKSLQDFFNQKSQAMMPETPAQSDALQKAGQWGQAVTSETDSVNKADRQYKRAYYFRQVANTVPNSIEEVQQKAQAYQELADQARGDGAETEALQMETQAQNALNQIPNIQERGDKQALGAERKDIINIINSLANDYHDGTITADQFSQAIPDLESRALSIGDTSIQLSLNKWSDHLYKDAQKGVVRGTFNGLPVVVKRGQGGSGSGTQTNWDTQDFDYSDNLRLAKALLDSGKIDGNKYVELIGKSIEERTGQLEGRVQTIYEMAKENPNAKVVFEGRKTRAADVLDTLYKYQEDVQGQQSAYEGGTFAVAMVAPNDFNKSGDTKKGKSVATFQLIDTNNMPEGQYIQDKQGIYHKVQKGSYKLKAGDMSNVQNFGTFSVYVDPNTQEQFSVKQDASGNPYIEKGGQYVDLYEPGTSYKIKVDVKPGDKIVEDYASIVKKDLMGKLQKAADLKKQELNTQKQTQNQTKQVVQAQNKPVDLLQTAKAIGAKIITPPIQPMDVVKAATPVLQPVFDAVKSAISPQALKPSPIASPPKISFPSNAVVSPPNPSLPKPNLGQNTVKAPSASLQPAQVKPMTVPQPQPAQSLNPLQFVQQKVINPVVSFAQKLWPFKK